MSPTDFETIRCRADGPLFRITLERPEVFNAIDGRLLVELREALAHAAADRALRVLVIAKRDNGVGLTQTRGCAQHRD